MKWKRCCEYHNLHKNAVVNTTSNARTEDSRTNTLYALHSFELYFVILVSQSSCRWSLCTNKSFIQKHACESLLCSQTLQHFLYFIVRLTLRQRWMKPNLAKKCMIKWKNYVEKIHGSWKTQLQALSLPQDAWPVIMAFACASQSSWTKTANMIYTIW